MAMSGVTCYTAPGEIFEDRQSLQEHYKSEWHRYNLKRKVAGLPPLPRDQFEARKSAALAAKGDQEAKAASHKLDHVKDNKKEKVAGRVAQRKKIQTNGDTAVMMPKPPTAEEEASSMKDDNDNGEEEEEEDDEEEAFEVDLRRSLFDSTLSEDIDGSLAYMAKKYGFFLPDVEYVSDLHGLVEYLHEKIGVGHVCLYCNKGYRSASGCRQHMIDSSHCKIRYDDQEDMDEVSDYYDFTSANENVTFDTKKNIKGAEQGAEETDELESDEEIDLGENKTGIEVMPSGELLITRPDGTRKTIGVRWLKKYYAQNARVIDERASVVAAQRERLRNIYRQMGVSTDSELMNQLVAAEGGHGESQALMKRYHRDTRYTHGLELQAARQHFKREHLKYMKLGINENLNIKNRFRATRIRAEGIGVHG